MTHEKINELLNAKKLTNIQREMLYRRLCFLLAKNDIPQAFLCDPILPIVTGECNHIEPSKVEKWAGLHGHCTKYNESIYQMVERVYGREAARIVDKLI